MNISFTKKEILHLLVSALVIGLVFGFDDGREVFEAKLWFVNYVLMSCLGLISLAVMVLGHKWAAGRYSIKSEYNLWGISRFGFKEYQKLPVPHVSFIQKLHLGIILPLTIAVFSEGQIWLASVGMILTSMKAEHRIGRKWIQITDYEEARIAFAGPVATMIFLIILGLFFENSGANIWKTLIIMNMVILGSHMLPFPQLAGGKMIFTSFYLFVFALALTVAIILF